MAYMVTIEIDESNAPTAIEAAEAAYHDIRSLSPLIMSVVDDNDGAIHRVAVYRGGEGEYTRGGNPHEYES